MRHTADGNDPDRDEHVQLSLGAYVLRTLPVDEVAEVEAHLARCARCSIECAELSEARAALALLPAAFFETADPFDVDPFGSADLFLDDPFPAELFGSAELSE